jgi:DNA-binding HxlR family transcriptional regulator
MDMQNLGDDPSRDNHHAIGLSYKFQRLREQLRTAVNSGELSGKLPGERLLARKFQVNAKTLSKALTDLAAEGLLDRSIGRGTYVKSATPVAQSGEKSWILLCEAGRGDSAMVCQMLQANPRAVLISDLSALRPSFLNQFDAIIDVALNTPDRFLRDMQVRGMPVIAVNREPGVYSVDTVAVDRSLGAASLARDLILGGHRSIAVVESFQGDLVTRAVQQTAARYRSDMVISACTPETFIATIKGGATAVICDAASTVQSVRALIEAEGLQIPQDVSLAAICVCDAPYSCSGQFVESATVVQAIRDLLGAKSTRRPTIIWLAPSWIDQGSMRPLPRAAGEAA